MKRSESVENFLKTVYVLQQHTDRVSTNALAKALDISAPSVTDMARRLVEAGYIDYERYHGVLLTDKGEMVALHVLRRHRLIELYLVEELDYTLSEVHDEAESLEHAVSDRFIEAIAAKLDHPEVDPHGDPIPAQDGTIARRDMLPLAELPLDKTAKVRRFIAESSDMLQHIMDRGFKLDADVSIKSRDPFDGPVTVMVNQAEQVIGHNVAACILVEVDD